MLTPMERQQPQVSATKKQKKAVVNQLRPNQAKQK